MRIEVIKVISQAAAPVTVLALLLAICGGFIAGQRLDRIPRKPTAAESQVLLARVHGTLASLQRRSAALEFNLETAIQAFKAKLPPPLPPPAVVDTAPPVAPAAITIEKPSVATPPPSPEPQLRVTGIISNKERILVCVNNRILGVGGSVAGFKVVKIEPHQVTFDNQQGRIRVIRFK
jgi:hypothetical protein